MESSKLLTEDEKEELKNYNNLTIKELGNKFPGKDKRNIRYYCKKFGITIKPTKGKNKYKIDDEVIPSATTALNIYSKKYNLTVNEEDIYGTFTVIEWYEMFYEGRLARMPGFVTGSKENWIKIMRHIAFNKYRMKSKEDILKINKKFLEKNRVTNIRYIISQQVYKVLQECFPEFNIQPWELTMASAKYFSKIENREYAIDLFIDKNGFSFNDILEKKLEVSQKMDEFGIYNSIYRRFMSYENMFIEYYKTKNIIVEAKDFKNIILSSDGITKLHSMEEKIVFDYVKYELNLEIEAIGLNRGLRFYNEELNENYYPDFIIENLLDKPIVIEYFGWFIPGNKNNLIKSYVDKTHRKNNYFRNLEDIYYIDLYPKDLKDKCQSIKDKFEKMVNMPLKGGEID